MLSRAKQKPGETFRLVERTLSAIEMGWVQKEPTELQEKFLLLICD